MKILAIEFSSPTRSVAVWDAGSAPAPVCRRVSGAQAAKPMAMIQAVLDEAGQEREAIERIAVGLGPGSYNGIRLALAIAQGWHLARGVTVAGVDSLLLVANQLMDQGHEGRIHTVTDAQRDEYGLGTYEIVRGQVNEGAPLRLVNQDTVKTLLDSGGTVAGAGLERLGIRELPPDAATLCRLALAAAPADPVESLQPIYLRPAQFVKAPPPRRI